MSKSLTDIISTADPKWINGTRIDRLPDGRWRVSAPSRFSRNAWAVETHVDLGAALRDAWGPYEEDAASKDATASAAAPAPVSAGIFD